MRIAKPRRIVLVGCSKSKWKIKPDQRRGGRVKPEELYSGSLFQKRVQYAKQAGLPWYVLSAKYGVWRPDCDRAPYDECMADKIPAEKAVWVAHCAYTICHELWEEYDTGDADGPIEPKQLTVEIHAGKLYAQPLADILTSLGIRVSMPCRGLGIGEQLALYTTGELSCPTTPASNVSDSTCSKLITSGSRS